jgi:hypothetical protein
MHAGAHSLDTRVHGTDAEISIVLETQSSLLLDTREENRLPARVEAAAQWTIAMSINVDADALRIFHALTVPEYLEAWIAMPERAADSAVVVSSVSNGYRLDHFEAGSVAVSITGSYLFCHHRKMRLCWRKTHKSERSDSLVDLRLRGNFGSSILELRHTGIASAGECRWHQALWCGSFQKLASLLRYA